MTTPPTDPNTAVFPDFSSSTFTFTSPWGFGGWVGGDVGLHFPAALPTVSGLPLSPLLTSPLVNNAVNNAVNRQLIHS